MEQQATPPGLVPRDSVNLTDGVVPPLVTTDREEASGSAAQHHADDDALENENILDTQQHLLVEEASEEGVEYSDEEDAYVGGAGGDELGGARGRGGGGAGELFSAADLVYEYAEGDECRICLMDERKGELLSPSFCTFFLRCYRTLRTPSSSSSQYDEEDLSPSS
jgi:hypothetical protein